MELEYYRIHNWLSYHHGKANKCENEKCKSVSPKRYEWALLKGKDYKKDRNNYIMLCPSCHRKYDITEEQRKKISMSRIYKSKIGTLFSDQHRANLSKSLKGINSIKVIKISKDMRIVQEYASVTIASKENNILQSSISNALTGRSKTAGGYIWEYTQKN